MKISVIGLGYVGNAMRAVLSRVHDVQGYDIDPKKGGELSSLKEASDFSSFFLLCLPTDYNEETHHFNTAPLDETIEALYALNPHSRFLIKSTVPMGYCEAIAKAYPLSSVFFFPEFLREASALKDALYPSRIVLGHEEGKKEEAEAFLQEFLKCCPEDTPALLMSLGEAEAVKLFSNTYLALRVAFFNELDSYALSKGLSASSIIEGVGLDPRIGSHYCNPSFGYGGYCLPKDTKQLEVNFQGIPQNLISAVIASNATRKSLLAKEIYERVKGLPNPVVGIYRLRMENDSSSLRSTCMQGLIEELSSYPVRIQIFEPLWKEPTAFGHPVMSSLEDFLASSDLVVANRMDENLQAVSTKVFTRDRAHQ